MYYKVLTDAERYINKFSENEILNKASKGEKLTLQERIYKKIISKA